MEWQRQLSACFVQWLSRILEEAICNFQPRKYREVLQCWETHEIRVALSGPHSLLLPLA